LPGRQKTRIGVVVGDKMHKTVIVAIETFRRHPVYKKLLRRTRRYKVHDERGECGLGDQVRIVETRPLSREKRWRVAEILVKGEVAEIAPKEIDAELIGQDLKEAEVEEVTAEAPPEAPAEAAAPEAELPEEAVEAEAEAPEEVVEEVEAAEEPVAEEKAPAEAEAEAEAAEEPVAEEEPPAEAEAEAKEEPEAEEKPKRRSRRKKTEEPSEE
jgi:small subunit ribosomal protein S17